MNYSEYNPFRGSFRVVNSEPGSRARRRAVFLDNNGLIPTLFTAGKEEIAIKGVKEVCKDCPLNKICRPQPQIVYQTEIQNSEDSTYLLIVKGKKVHERKCGLTNGLAGI